VTTKNLTPGKTTIPEKKWQPPNPFSDTTKSFQTINPKSSQFPFWSLDIPRSCNFKSKKSDNKKSHPRKNHNPRKKATISQSLFKHSQKLSSHQSKGFPISLLISWYSQIVQFYKQKKWQQKILPQEKPQSPGKSDNRNPPIPFQTQPKAFKPSIQRVPNFPFGLLIFPDHTILRAKKVTTKNLTPGKTTIPGKKRQSPNPFSNTAKSFQAINPKGSQFPF
jgi:hypothetical protein